MNRRGFLGSVAALIVAPKAVPNIALVEPRSVRPSGFAFIDPDAWYWIPEKRTIYWRGLEIPEEALEDGVVKMSSWQS